MNLVKFKEVNLIIAENQPQYLPFPCYRVRNDPEAKVYACWELSDDELAEVIKTRKIWQTILTFNNPLQPQGMSAYKPEELYELTD